MAARTLADPTLAERARSALERGGVPARLRAERVLAVTEAFKQNNRKRVLVVTERHLIALRQRNNPQSVWSTVHRLWYQVVAEPLLGMGYEEEPPTLQWACSRHAVVRVDTSDATPTALTVHVRVRGGAVEIRNIHAGPADLRHVRTILCSEATPAPPPARAPEAPSAPPPAQEGEDAGSDTICTPGSVDDGPPDAFVCPITSDLMVDPVIAESGHSFERDAIAKWLKEGGTCPLSRVKIGPRLIPNVTLRKAIEEWREKYDTVGVAGWGARMTVE